MKKLTLGVIGTSKKEDEKRVPIHPEHLSRLPEDMQEEYAAYIEEYLDYKNIFDKSEADLIALNERFAKYFFEASLYNIKCRVGLGICVKEDNPQEHAELAPVAASTADDA